MVPLAEGNWRLLVSSIVYDPISAASQIAGLESWLYHLIALWPWEESNFTSPNLGLLGFLFVCLFVFFHMRPLISAYLSGLFVIFTWCNAYCEHTVLFKTSKCYLLLLSDAKVFPFELSFPNWYFLWVLFFSYQWLCIWELTRAEHVCTEACGLALVWHGQWSRCPHSFLPWTDADHPGPPHWCGSHLSSHLCDCWDGPPETWNLVN